MRFLTIAYIDVFRAIPLLILILLISGSLAFLPLPEALTIPQWFGKPDNFWYAVMALTLVYGAYLAEVYRAGIEAVPNGQMEAARSLGMGHGQAMRSVIVPQAVRKVIAPMLNEFTALLKDTTLASVIALNEVAPGRQGHPDQDLQQLGADPRRDHVPGHRPSPRPRRRPADRPRAAPHLARRHRSGRPPLGEPWPSQCSD